MAEQADALCGKFFNYFEAWPRFKDLVVDPMATTAGTRGALMRQVSDVLDQAKSFVTSRDPTPPSAARPKAE